MADETMRQEYPDLRQRLAVCSAQGKNEQQGETRKNPDNGRHETRP